MRNSFPTLFTFLMVIGSVAAIWMPPVKLGIRDSLLAIFAPVSRPGGLIARWGNARLFPPQVTDMTDPAQPRTVQQLLRENSRLTVENENLRAQLEDLRALSAQYQSLGTDMRKLVQPARVISGPMDRRRTITIDTTTLTNVREKMAVLHPAGLVGSIQSVGIGIARVVLLTDPQSRVECQFVRLITMPDGHVGRQPIAMAKPLIEGTGDEMVIKFLPAPDARARLRVGDLVLLDDLSFPVSLKGMTLGKIRSITMPPTDAGHAEVFVEPTTDFLSLREVLVLTK